MGRNGNGIGTGVLLITIGMIFFADRQGFGGFDRFWPLILIVAGMSRMLFPRDYSIRAGVVAGRRGCRRYHPFGGLWLVIVGGIFLLNQNHILGIHESWPLFIVAAGLGIIFSGIFPTSRTDSDSTMGQGGRS